MLGNVVLRAVPSSINETDNPQHLHFCKLYKINSAHNSNRRAIASRKAILSPAATESSQNKRTLPAPAVNRVYIFDNN